MARAEVLQRLDVGVKILAGSLLHQADNRLIDHGHGDVRSPGVGAQAVESDGIVRLHGRDVGSGHDRTGGGSSRLQPAATNRITRRRRADLCFKRQLWRVRFPKSRTRNSGCHSAGSADLPAFWFVRKALNISTGIGKMVVVFCSTPISSSVCR